MTKRELGAPQIEDLRLPHITLESGGVVDPHVLRMWRWGPAGAPAVLVVHALTGDARVGDEGGWWAQVVGPGRALDPTRVQIIGFNNLGSRYGSSGPTDPAWPGGDVSTWDQARSMLMALDAAGISKVSLLTGGSLGGMICLTLAALDPTRFSAMMPIAACLAASSWIVGFNHVQREVLRLDPGYPDDVGRGLEIARQIALLTYRAEPGLHERQGRREGAPGSGRRFAMQSYLEHQGDKFVARFDAATYEVQATAMDHHDMFRAPTTRDAHETWRVSDTPVDDLSTPTLAVGIDTDQLFFPRHMQELAHRLEARGVRSAYAEIASLHGHDAFLIEWNQLDALLRRALSLGGVPK